MTIFVKNKHTLLYKDFIFRCCVGRNNFSKKKVEGDKKTPIGVFNLENLYYREDRFPRPITKLKICKIKKDMGWCNDSKEKKYNKLIKVNKKIRHEKLFRSDYKYDLFIPIKYNWNKRRVGGGSAIFLHLITKKFNPTQGCIAIRKKDFIKILPHVTKKTKLIIR